MLTAIDLFCGAGGLSLGFQQTGFSILAGNDTDEYAMQTYSDSHPNSASLCMPIQSISVRQLKSVSGLQTGDLDCLIGGPPCQAFSVYNHQRGFHDERSVLFREYLRIVEGLMPKWVVMENVTGITSVGGGRAVKEIYSGLRSLGYFVEMRKLNAEDYGIPQERRRIFFLASRDLNKISWPTITHGQGLQPIVTVWDAISDLPELQNGQDPGERNPYRINAESDFQRALRGNCQQITNHSAPRLAPINLDRMKYIPEGGSWRDIPIELLPKGMKRARRCDHTKRYGRLRKDGLSSTILTKCDLHWGAFVHPTQDRVLTVREAARLQSFPDSVVFKGPRTEQYVQVGNAVPPMLGRAVAIEIARLLTSDFKDELAHEEASQFALVG